MTKIIIEVDTEEDEDKILFYLEDFLIDNFNDFKLSINEKIMTELKNGKVTRTYDKKKLYEYKSKFEK